MGKTSILWLLPTARSAEPRPKNDSPNPGQIMPDFPEKSVFGRGFSSRRRRWRAAFGSRRPGLFSKAGLVLIIRHLFPPSPFPFDPRMCESRKGGRLGLGSSSKGNMSLPSSFPLSPFSPPSLLRPVPMVPGTPSLGIDWEDCL